MTPTLNSTLPYSVSTLRRPTRQELKQCGVDYCVALCLHQAIARDDRLDIDWSDVVEATGRYVPMVSSVEQPDHAVLAHLHSASRLALHATIHAGAERFQIEQERAALRQALAEAAGEVETSAPDRRRARL